LDQYINERLCGKLLKPFQIEQTLSRYIVGQDKFIKDLSLEIYKYELTLRTPPDKRPDLKTNNHCILLWGDTGSGKTYAISRIAELFDANVLSVSLNLVTSSGYYGQNLDAQIFAQYRNIRKSKKSSFSILFLDEIDKLCSKLEIKSDVLNELLVLLSDRKLSYEEKSGRKETISMKFDSYLIIMAGNFIKLKKNNIRVKRIMGFSNQANSKIEANSELADAQFLTDVLGHELVGRIGSILRVENLNKKDVLKNILLNAESSPLHYIKHFMERHSKEFVYSEKEIDEIASIAARSRTGVRGLNTATMEFYKNQLLEVANENEVVDKSIKKILEDELPF
jgi:ATP-dependent protease Clp ATPase subunit